VVLGAVFCLVGSGCDLAYAVISGNGGDWLRGRSSFSRYQRDFSAPVYFALAALAMTAHVDRSTAGQR
jgi:threonine/homoserine/homoserine lactone efflux protein